MLRDPNLSIAKLAPKVGMGSGNLGNLTKTGEGTQVLEGDNTYTGLTSVQAGTLQLDGSLAGGLTVASGAWLTGIGSVTGATVIDGTHSPGDSPGIQSFGDLTYGSGGATPSVTWELISNTADAADRGSQFDGVDVSGALAFADPTSLNLVFNDTGSTVDWEDSFWAGSYTGTAGWLIYSGATSLDGFGNLSITQQNWLDGNSLDFNSLLLGGFSLHQEGSDIYLNYNFVPIPEPSTLALAGLALAALTLRRRRR